MAIINKGTAFSNGEQLSASKLNDLVDGATFGTDSVDNSSTLLNGTGAITVRDSGITAAKLATNAVTTAKILNANVTKAKIENVADYKVLGNVSGAAAAPQEVAILDEDDMVSNSATALATQQSIKAYVDDTAGGFTPSTYAGEESVTLPNGLIMKFGTVSVAGNTTTTVTFDANLDVFTGTVNAQLTPIEDSQTDLSQPVKVGTLSNTQLTIRNTAGTTYDVYWQVIGY
jgi:hypothetical protein